MALSPGFSILRPPSDSETLTVSPMPCSADFAHGVLGHGDRGAARGWVVI